MKVFTACLAFIICTFARGAEPPGIDYHGMNIIDLTSLDERNSLGISIGSVKLMFESMERKLLQTENHVRMLEDKLQTYEGKNMLIEQLEKKSISAEKSLKTLEDSLRESETVRSVQVENLTRKLESMEHRLSHVDELEMKLHKAESRLSLVEKLEAKLKAVEKILVKMNIETSDDKMEELSALSEESKPATIHSKRGIPLDDHIAFSVSNVIGEPPFHPGQRLTFATLDYSEGGGFHMSTGTFICPKSGTYFFVATLSSNGHGYVQTVIKVDGAVKIRQYSSYKLPGDNLSTGATVTHCQAGASVWMEFVQGEHLSWVTMSGFLLWPDI